MIDFSNETLELELETLGMFHIVAYLHLFPEIQFPLNKNIVNILQEYAVNISAHIAKR